MTDPPLHVQVAQALTGTQWCPGDEGPYDGSSGVCLRCGFKVAPHYDSDWSATGPLIQRFQICLQAASSVDRPQEPDSEWQALSFTENDPDPWHEAWAPTPLLAVCQLILNLHKAGKLDNPSHTS